MKRKLSLLLALSIITSMCFSGCSNESQTSTKTESKETVATESKTDAKPALDEVTLEWYIAVPSAGQRDLSKVNEEFNKLTKEKINAKVNLNFIDFGNYAQQMQMKLTSNAQIDLMYTSNWTNDFYADVARGAYKELNMDKIKELAPNVINGLPEAAWSAAKVNGKLYAIPNTQVLGKWPSVLVQTKYIDKYKFDTKNVDSIDDFTPLFEQIAKNEQGVYPIDVHKGTDILGYMITEIGFEHFSNTNPFAVKLGDKDLKVTNLYETKEMTDFLHLLRDWNKKGIIRKDAATVTDTAGEISNGMYASIFAVNNPDTVVNQAKNWKLKPEELTIVPIADPFMSTGAIVGTMEAVGQASKNEDRVYMLYNMLYDEKDTRLLNLLSYGIEGTHYTKVEDDLIELKPDSGYYVDCGWAYGNMFNSYRTNPIQPKWRPAGPDINKKSIVSDMLGFSLDPTPIKSELAQINSVMGEMTPALMTGSVDVDNYLKDFIQKLKKAGSHTVQKQIQDQINKWKSSK